VFELKAKGAEREPLWAYRYRLEGRGSSRPQVGGFASRAEAQKALQKKMRRDPNEPTGARPRLLRECGLLTAPARAHEEQSCHRREHCGGRACCWLPWDGGGL
jgi:hypothetical protein